MKRFFLLLTAASFAVVGCSSHKAAPETYNQSRTLEDGGTGDYKAIMVAEPSLAEHTIFRPADLSPFNAKNPLPVLVWGNGACGNSPWEHVNFLNEIASHGFMVVAIGNFPVDDQPDHGPMSKTEQQIEGLDWAVAQNADKNSPYYQKLDMKNIAAAGMSCGGLQTLNNATDERLKTIMICNSGSFIDPNTAIPGMPMPTKDDLQKIKVPVLYMLCDTTDIAYVNGMDDFSRINNVPVAACNLPVGHGGTYRQPYGGEFAIVATAWLKWQLKNDDEAALMFKGENPGVAQREGWRIDKKNID